MNAAWKIWQLLMRRLSTSSSCWIPPVWRTVHNLYRFGHRLTVTIYYKRSYRNCDLAWCIPSIYCRVILWKSTASVFPWCVIPRRISLVTAVLCCAFESLPNSDVSFAGNLNNRACRSGSYTAQSLIMVSSSVLQAGHRVSTTFLWILLSLVLVR